MDKTLIISQFYEAFKNKDAEKMTDFYSDEITFEDPAFGKLKGIDAKKMWHMLIERGGKTMSLTYSNILETKNGATAQWQATYLYGSNKRKVVNLISSKFIIENGRIIKHTDTFNLWNWSRQALGFSGYLLGWSSFMKNKIQQKTTKLLKNYQINTIL